MLFWNCKGTENWTNMDDRSFGQAEVIATSETWVMGDVYVTQEEENNYHWYQVKTEKETGGSRDRASGGLVGLIRKCFQVKLLGTNTNWILIRLIKMSPETVVGGFYFKPKLNPEKGAAN
uniref:Uncharacterized protein n=1 Tax=Cacopsylla melanoneura TaxID=428564 RepID=A0A8D8MAZ1_9HEMI